MRIIYIYILSFCLLLFGGYRYAQGGTHHHPQGYTAAQHVEKAQQVKFTTIGDDATAVSIISPDDKQSIFTVEDDDDIAFSRKYVLLTNYFVTLAFASFLIYCCNYFKKRSHVRRQLAVAGSKYISQGALRI